MVRALDVRLLFAGEEGRIRNNGHHKEFDDEENEANTKPYFRKLCRNSLGRVPRPAEDFHFGCAIAAILDKGFDLSTLYPRKECQGGGQPT